MIRTILLNGSALRYELHRKQVKNINLRIRSDGSLSVSAPHTVPTAEIEAFLRAKESFIRRALSRAAPPEPRNYDSGERFWLFGVPKTLRVLSGAHNMAAVSGEYLTVYVRQPESAALRQRVICDFFRAQCRETVLRICRQVSPAFQARSVPEPEIRFRAMKARWGSCQPVRHLLTFSYTLAEVSLPCVEYVVLHEFTHFLHPNHSPAFYKCLSEFLPDWKSRRDLLNGGFRTADRTRNEY